MNLRAIHILRAGTFSDSKGRDVTFTKKQLELIAAGYDPTHQAAPLVLGHPEDKDTRPLGTVRGLVADGDNLFAIGDISHELIAHVRDARYRKVSVSVYAPGQRGNPTPSGYYLRHVGFLGAAVPAVTGLLPLHFADALNFADSHGRRQLTTSEQLYQVATDIRAAGSSSSFIAVAISAERALKRK